MSGSAHPDTQVQEKADRLVAILRSYGSVAVAFSGGVDSAVVARAAHEALGDKAVAVTAASPSVAQAELEDARRVAQLIGIRHVIVQTAEIEKSEYRQNAPDRCYHCKTELYSRLGQMLEQLGVDVIANGANLDDRGDWRPGMIAAREHQVRSPLIEAGLGKADVRALAKHWGLPVWDKPAAPCLASRIAYGVEVTPGRLRMIEAAEAFLRSLGFRELRVRLPEPETARIEVPIPDLARLLDLREEVVRELKSIGFKFVTVDLEGLRSGSLNALIDPDTLLRVGNR